MNELKRNPAKYVRLFGLLYVVIWFVESQAEQVKLMLNYNAEFNLTEIFTYTGLGLAAVAPYIIFLVYITHAFEKKKNHILLKIAYGLLLIMNYGGIRTLFYGQPSKFYILSGVVNTIELYLCFAVTVILLIDIFLGFKHIKLSQKAATVECVWRILFVIVYRVLYIVEQPIVENFIFAVLDLSAAVLYCAMSLTFWFYAVPHTSTTALELDLQELKKSYEAGQLSAEDYENRKNQILDRF